MGWCRLATAGVHASCWVYGIGTGEHMHCPGAFLNGSSLRPSPIWGSWGSGTVVRILACHRWSPRVLRTLLVSSPCKRETVFSEGREVWGISVSAKGSDNQQLWPTTKQQVLLTNLCLSTSCINTLTSWDTFVMFAKDRVNLTICRTSPTTGQACSLQRVQSHPTLSK